jgi:hypothetical protein
MQPITDDVRLIASHMVKLKNCRMGPATVNTRMFVKIPKHFLVICLGVELTPLFVLSKTFELQPLVSSNQGSGLRTSHLVIGTEGFAPPRRAPKARMLLLNIMSR